MTRVPEDTHSRSRFHGTTLSSFTSLTLHPHPLVAFSVRLPSRMADYLRPLPKSSQLPSALQQIASSIPDLSKSSLPIPIPRPALDLLASISRLTAPSPSTPGPELTVSLLAKSNEKIAKALSTAQADQSATFAMENTWDGTSPPALVGSIGRLRCEVVTSIPLRDVCGGCEEDGGVEGSHPGSELFICRVLSVEDGEREGGEPVLYWRHKYVGLQDEP